MIKYLFFVLPACLGATISSLEVQLDFSFKQTLPNFTLDTEGTQLLEADLEILDKEVLFTLKRLKVQLKNNDETITLDTREPSSSFYLTQVGKLINLPVRLPLKDDGTVQQDSAEIYALAGHLPVLREFDPAKLLAEVINPLFIFRDKKVKVGKKVALSNLEYEIVSVEGDRLEAVIRGEVEKKKVTLPGPDPLELHVTTTVRGEGIWQLQKSCSEWSLERESTAMVEVGGQQWLMTAQTAVGCQIKEKAL